MQALDLAKPNIRDTNLNISINMNKIHTSRKCTKCDKVKLLTEFYHAKRSPFGRMCACKNCSGDVKRKRIEEFPEIRVFNHARGRCINQKDKDYPKYGANGVQFKLTSWQKMITIIGRRPHGMSIDMIDSTGHYEPGNIRWATIEEQNRNRSTSLSLETVKAIRICHLFWMPQCKIKRLISIRQPTISKIIHNQRWADV